jgi:hypothetical protein
MKIEDARIGAQAEPPTVLKTSAIARKGGLLSALLTLLLALGVMSACGASMGPGSTAHSQPPPSSDSASPDSVRIAIDAGVDVPPGTPPVVTLSDVALVRQLYASIYALPAQPANGSCMQVLGPHYTLTFRQGTAPLVTVQAEPFDCVTIVGDTSVRQATKAFWQQLDQAIGTATPPLRPDRLAIAVTPPAGQTLPAPQSAQITSAATTQQLYDAILALPPAPLRARCPSVGTPTYQFVFFAGAQMAPACVYDTDQTVEIDGGYPWRGGVYTMNDQFRRLLRSLLAGAAFAPARPDQVALTMTNSGATSQLPVSDMPLLLALYERLFTLPVTASQPGCLPEKGAGVGTRFTFTQSNLLLVRIDTYEGSCRFVQEADTGQYLRADQAFWDLVHRALAA